MGKTELLQKINAEIKTYERKYNAAHFGLQRHGFYARLKTLRQIKAWVEALKTPSQKQISKREKKDKKREYKQAS